MATKSSKNLVVFVDLFCCYLSRIFLFMFLCFRLMMAIVTYTSLSVIYSLDCT